MKDRRAAFGRVIWSTYRRGQFTAHMTQAHVHFTCEISVISLDGYVMRLILPVNPCFNHSGEPGVCVWIRLVGDAKTLLLVKRDHLRAVEKSKIKIYMYSGFLGRHKSLIVLIYLIMQPYNVLLNYVQWNPSSLNLQTHPKIYTIEPYNWTLWSTLPRARRPPQRIGPSRPPKLARFGSRMDVLNLAVVPVAVAIAIPVACSCSPLDILSVPATCVWWYEDHCFTSAQGPEPCL